MLKSIATMKNHQRRFSRFYDLHLFCKNTAFYHLISFHESGTQLALALSLPKSKILRVKLMQVLFSELQMSSFQLKITIDPAFFVGLNQREPLILLGSY